MKLRCPYCKEIIEDLAPHSTCPHCKKVVIIPERLREGPTARDRRKARERIAREADRQMKAIRVHNFQPGRKPSTLLLVIGVLVVLGGLLISKSMNNNRELKTVDLNIERIAKAEREVTTLRMALEWFKNDCKRYPTAEEGLVALVLNPNIKRWDGHYVNKVQSDPWRNKYVFSSKRKKVILFSLGPDGTAGTQDDIYPDEDWKDKIPKRKKRK